jgi:hypothetical protein
MKQTIRRLLFLVALTAAANGVFALYGVTSEGAWPKSWPKEFEPLRKQSRTLVHSAFGIHEIKINSRREFESIWPHLLKFKSKGGTLTLHGSPNKKLGTTMKAGVRIISPLTGTKITPDGKSYPPNAKAKVTDEGVLTIGPPWPDSLRDKNGHLPEFVHNANGKWKVYKEGDGRRLALRRARCDIELIVDGKRIDLNRIQLPADTSIIDQRFPTKTE